MSPNSNPQELWKQDDAGLPNPLSTNEVCARARKGEIENIWARRIGTFALVVFAAAFAYNIWSVPQPWVRLGQAWMLTVVCVYLWSVIRSRPDRKASNESCAEFLQRSVRSKELRFLALRRTVFWIFPAQLATWWGGGPALKGRVLGLSPSSPYYHYLNSGWPFLATTLLLVLIWLAFSHAARKAAKEAESLQRRIAAA